MKKILLCMTAVLSLMACNNSRQNPFLTEWDTPYGIPPFGDIQVDDYIPAIEAGIEQQSKEIDSIVNNPEAPTFENTILPLELSGEILSKVSGVLYNVSETDRTDALDSVMEKAIPMLSEHSDNISFNKGLYERIAKLYFADQSQLTREQQMVLKHHFEAFERNGIGLPEEKQARLREINTEMATKTQKLGTGEAAMRERFLMTLSFSVRAPKLPPISKMVGFVGLRPKAAAHSCRVRESLSKLCLTGLPVSRIRSLGKKRSMPSYATHILLAFFARVLFVKPAKLFCS